MLYSFLKIWVRLASLIYCRRIIINDPSRLKMRGPLLLACNHPNSFLDAILLDILFKEPIWSMTRGDAFKKPFYKQLLHRLKMLPVYRSSEGVNNLEGNYQTFEQCKKLFRRNGLVLMFSEGLCINEWHLRPLKKGTARLAFSSWGDGIELKVLPVGINYSSFRRFGKNIFLNFGEPIVLSDFPEAVPEGKKYLLFNERLKSELSKIVYEIPITDRQAQKILVVPVPTSKKIILAIPAVQGLLLNAPLYLPLRAYAVKTAAYPEFVDGILTALLVLSYPFYVAIITLVLILLTGNLLSLLAIPILPVTAWAFVQLKRQV